MATNLEQKFNAILDSTSRMVLATSVDGLGSSASVLFARDGDDFLFFTSSSSRTARQVCFNPRVQLSIWPPGEEGIHGLRVEGNCYRIRQPDEMALARDRILAASEAFKDCMGDELLRQDDVTGYYRVKPARMTLFDFCADTRLEFLDFPQNRPAVVAEMLGAVKNRLLLWLQAVRAPFFTATLVPVLLGAAIAFGDLAQAGLLGAWDWRQFWLVMIGALLAHAGTNLANDYGDHVSGNDERNRVPSPFNGGSRVIQAGLLAPWKVLFAAMLCFIATVVIGLELNQVIGGHAFASTPLLFFGVCGCLLGLSYTLGPYRLGYHGLGEIAIAVGFGPIIVLGTHYVLSAPLPGDWNWPPPLLASVPVAVFVVLIVWINQFQDVPADRLVDKNNWVVRCAAMTEGKIEYERPLELYRMLGYLGFGLVALIGLAGGIDARIGTLYALIAVTPLPLLIHANRLGYAWLENWNQDGADRQRLPYMLLRVNAITIVIHFSTGLLLVLAYGLRGAI